MAASLALASLASCSAPEPDNAPPPPPPAAEAYDRAPVELAGAPPPVRDQDGLAGGPAEVAPAPATTGMAPIPNPEDLAPAERHRIYGTEYDGDRGVVRQDDGPVPDGAQPDAGAPARPASIGQPHARSPAVVRTPSSQKSLTPTPAATPAPPVTTAVKPLDPKLAKLQAALAPSISAGATLTLGEPLSQRREGPVVLSLPPTLFDLIRQEAAKLGLGRAARVGEVSATLSGQGYDIMPAGPQTAWLKSGEAASFQWQVRPGAGELGPLRAQIDAALRGQRTPMSFPLGTITKAAPVPEAAPATSGLGKMRRETLVGGGLLLLALVLLVAIARNASLAEERARLRRKAAENSQEQSAPAAKAALRKPKAT